MPLPFIAGMLIGAGAITAYNNKEKVMKYLKTGFATAKESGENLVQKVKSKCEKKPCKPETQVVEKVSDECAKIAKSDHICEPVCTECGEKNVANNECKSEICQDCGEKTDEICEYKEDKAQNLPNLGENSANLAQNETPKNVTTKKSRKPKGAK